MLNDLRHSLRALAKSPVFAAVAIATLMLGIGVNTAMFSIVNGAVLRGLPFPDQHRVIHIENNNLKEGIDSMGVSWDDFADIRAAQTTVEDLAVYQERTFNLSGPGGDPERVQGCAITWSGPGMLRVPPHMGRWFHEAEGEPGSQPVVVLGYTVWKNRFGGDPAILGTQVKVNGEWATIVGVGPQNYRFPSEADAWMPLRERPKDTDRKDRYWEVFGRLKPGATIETARAEIYGIVKQLEVAHPDSNENVGAVVKPLRDEFVGDDTRSMLGVMLGAVFLVMLIACANLANLLLARAAVRQKEIAVRSALGAGRRRIVRFLLSEALILSVTGAALGLALGFGLMAIFNHFINATNPPPYWMIFKIDGVSILFVAGLAVFSCIAAGLWPAWRASRGDLMSVLKDGSRGSTGFALSRFTRVMVIGEVVLSCVLLVLSGLAIRSVIKMQSSELGYETAGIFTNRVGLPEAEYPQADAQKLFYQRLVENLSARPEIESAAVSTNQPTWNNRSTVIIEGQPYGKDAPRRFATRTAVSGSYFETLGIPVLQGRTFDDRDAANAMPVAVVCPQFAQKFWPGENPVGQRFAYNDGSDPASIEWITVIGVVGRTLVGEFHGSQDSIPQAYTPFNQREEVRFMTVFSKARAGEPENLAPVVRGAVQELNENLPIYWPQTLEEMVAKSKFFKKLFAWIFGVFGAVALMLSAVGLYGVMAYSVSQRTQEIGVRMALGASPGSVLKLILREGGVRLAIGLAIGMVLSFFAAKLQTSSLYGITPQDPVTYAGTIVTLAVAGVAACLVPALRALRVNPVEALRNE